MRGSSASSARRASPSPSAASSASSATEADGIRRPAPPVDRRAQRRQGGRDRLRPGRPHRRRRPGPLRLPTSPSSRRSTCPAACSATASPSSACPRRLVEREVNTPAGAGREDRDQRGRRQDVRPSPELMQEKASRPSSSAPAPGCRPSWGSRARIQRRLLGQRVPDPRQPDGRLRVPLPRHAGERRPERGGHRRRQHRHGLPARSAHRRRERPLRLPAHRGRGPGPHRGDPPRQGGGDRLLLAPRPGGDLRRPRGQREGHEGRGDGTRRPRREGAPQARSHRSLQGPGLRHRHLRARHEGEPHHHPGHPGLGPQQVGQRGRRRQGPGHDPSRRVRRR